MNSLLCLWLGFPSFRTFYRTKCAFAISKFTDVQPNIQPWGIILWGYRDSLHRRFKIPYMAFLKFYYIQGTFLGILIEIEAYVWSEFYLVKKAM